VLEPLFFLLYNAFDVIAECGNCNADSDDTQTYISVPAADAASAVQQFVISVEKIEFKINLKIPFFYSNS